MSDRYQIQAKIGQGGLGAVYKAFDTQLKREVALKRVLTPEEGSAEEVTEAAEKLLKEATVLSALMHPNIVTIFDIGQDDSGGFVVMELLDGETLDETIGRGLLTVRDFGEVVNQTLEAMIAAQAVNLLHRDLKPTNVMVIWRPSGKFQIKVLDFGLAKISEQPSIQTIDHGDAILGSIYFMAPEQFERRKLDFRTDMYALGCIYYYSLTGKYPFDGESAPQVMAAHLQHKVKPLKEMRPDLPDDVCQWVMWLINRDITKRPGNAREALERFPDPDRPSSSAPVYVAEVVEEEPLEAIPVPDPAAAEAEPTTGGVVSVAGSGKKFKTGPTPGSQVKRKTSGVSSRVPLKTGPIGGSGATTGHHGSHAAAAAELAEQDKAKKKKLGIIVGSIISCSLLLIIALVQILGALSASQQEERMIELVNGDPPKGTVDDIPMLVAKLDPSAEDPRARGILATIMGSGIDESLVAELQVAEAGPIRYQLVGIVRSRAIVEAFDQVLLIFRGTSDPKLRNIAASALAALADSPADLKELLQLLRNEPLDNKERAQLEIAIITLLRMDESVDDRIAPILAALDQSPGGTERQSLCKILGACGGRKALTKIETIFADGDGDYQKDAMSALNVWPDRQVAKVLASLVDNASNGAIRKAAVRALARLQQLPSKRLDVGNFRKAIENAGNAQDTAKAILAAYDRPTPEMIEFLRGLKFKDEAVGKYRDKVAEDIQKLISEAVPVKSGELISVEPAHIRGSSGNSGNYYNVEAGYFENWNDPNVWLMWIVTVDQPGTYEIQVFISCDGAPGSKIEVLIGQESKYATIPRTAEWDEFSPIQLGEFNIATPGTHIIYLRAGRIVQRRIANIQGIQLTKKQ